MTPRAWAGPAAFAKAIEVDGREPQDHLIVSVVGWRQLLAGHRRRALERKVGLKPREVVAVSRQPVERAPALFSMGSSTCDA